MSRITRWLTRTVVLALLAASVALAADTAALMKKGDAALAEGEYARAYSFYDRILKEEPQSTGALAGRGICALNLRKYAQAKTDLEKAIEIEPERQDCRNPLAWCLYYYGDVTNSRKMMRKAHAEGGIDEEADKQLLAVLDGPYRKKYPDTYKKLVGRSKTGRYRLTTDLGARPDVAIEGEHTNEWWLAAALLDKIYEVYAREFPFPKDDKIVFNVIIFKRKKDYEKYEKLLGNKAGSTAGMYASSLKTLLVEDDAETGEGTVAGLHAETVDTIFHEGLHQFVDFYVENAPPWFDEGLGEFFGPTTIDEETGQFKFGAVSTARLEVIKKALAGDGAPPVPLTEFLLMPQEKFVEPDHVELCYSEAWAFMHFLRSEDRGQAILKKYLDALKAGKDMKGAFDAAFGGVNLDDLEAGWKKHVQGM